MKKKLTKLLLSTILFIPNIYSMDGPPAHKETLSSQRLGSHQFIAPGMMAIWNETPDSHMALKIFGQNNQLIYEARLPVLSLDDIAVTKDGTLYIFGRTKNYDYVVFGAKNGKALGQLKYGTDMSYHWDAVSNNKSLENLPGDLKDIMYFGFEQDGTLLVSAEYPKMQIFALKNGELELQADDFKVDRVMGSAPDDHHVVMDLGFRFAYSPMWHLPDLKYLGFTRDGTLIVSGQHPTREAFALKNGKLERQTDDYLKVDEFMGSALDGTSFIRKKGKGDKFSILKVKDGKVLGDLGFQRDQFFNLIIRPDGTLFIGAHSFGASRVDEIISVTKDGKAKFTGSQSYGLHDINNFAFGPDGTLFILGNKGGDSSTFSDVILAVKNGQTSELPNYGWLKGIEGLSVASDGTLFIRSGEHISENTYKNCILMVKDEKNLDNMCMELPSRPVQYGAGFHLIKIKGAIFLKDILTKNEEEKVFPKGHQEGASQQAFEDLCTTIRGFAPSLFSHEDGKAFYHFFAPHIINFRDKNSHVGYAIYSLLQHLTSNEKLLISGYAFALYFDVSGLQNEMITADSRMSSEKLLGLKKAPNFKERLKATKEAQKILEAIVSATSSDFSESYRLLLKNVDAALKILEPQEKAQTSTPHVK